MSSTNDPAELTKEKADQTGHTTAWKIGMGIGIGVLVVFAMFIITLIYDYFTYWQYTLVTGDDKSNYTLTTQTVTYSYIDNNKNSISIRFPDTSVVYVCSSADVSYIPQAQYLPPISGGVWLPVIEYNLFSDEAQGPYVLTKNVIKTVITQDNVSTVTSYNAGTKVTAVIDRYLNLTCEFEGPGVDITATSSPAV
jgi:hypothetical protein